MTGVICGTVLVYFQSDNVSMRAEKTDRLKPEMQSRRTWRATCGQSSSGGSPVAPRQEARIHEWRSPLIRGDSADQRPLQIAPPADRASCRSRLLQIAPPADRASCRGATGLPSQNRLPRCVSLVDHQLTTAPAMCRQARVVRLEQNPPSDETRFVDDAGRIKKTARN